MSALDANLRASVRTELKALHERLPNLTIVCVTHDQDDALVLSDRTLLMRDGRIAQLGTPRELYDTPNDAFVARYLGAANLLPPSIMFPIGDARHAARDQVACVRPECLSIVPLGAGATAWHDRVGGMVRRGVVGVGHARRAARPARARHDAARPQRDAREGRARFPTSRGWRCRPCQQVSRREYVADDTAYVVARRRRERLAQWQLWFILVVVLGPLVIYPLAQLLLLSVSGAHGLSLHAYTAFFGSPETSGVIGTTLGILFASATLASLLGVLLASMLFFKPFPGARLVTRFLELFVAFPSFLVAFTLIFLYGSQGSVSIGLQRLFNLANPPLDFLFGIGGVILAEVVFYAPFVVRPTLASFATLDMRLIEAAKSLGANGWMVAFKVILPLAWPGIAAGTILCFLLTLNEFGILLVLGSAHLITLPTAIYSRPRSISTCRRRRPALS